ncbi:MAG: TRAP transporter small permease subunit [Deltaproteobacteria bacterium]|nr:TRAP transporter small permease subunit [Deltaproteobacteria bacterium]
MKLLPYLETVNKKISLGLLCLAGFFMVLMVVLACSNMVLRAVWVPVKGTFELMGFSGALAAAFALAATQRGKGHITVTLLKGHLPAWLEKTLVLFSFVLSGSFFLLVSWHCGQRALGIWRLGELSETLQVIYYPVVFAVALGFVALGLALVTDFFIVLFSSNNRRRS